MDDLIAALNILRKYGNPNRPTGSEHDILYVYINPEVVSTEDLQKLEELGFDPDDDLGDCFHSYKFGSA